ncbi:MAG: methyltransferase domain-containing protein [Deltaproteobacteria bacterium]|nr:methyltransferase domain-containing protein [Deltaproteobacteria bacterium]
MAEDHREAKNVANGSNGAALDVEHAVQLRYGGAAQEAEFGLCVPVEYDRSLLEAIPDEIIEKDYGCGDPSRHVKRGETVLDLGSGSGKACYMMSQIVGKEGRVVGIDFTEKMLNLARSHQQAIGNRLGFHNVEFRRGKIQDLRLDLERVEEYLRSHPVSCLTELNHLREFEESLSHDEPMIPDESIDVVVSNCVLNLVKAEDKKQLFAEMYRVLRRGGRVAISDIVSDEPVPESMKNDPTLWSGCVSGAFQEEELVQAFEEVGFYGIRVEAMPSQPYETVQGIEFRSITLTAYKGKEGPCIERNHAVIYRGPWKQVLDDDHHTFPRGVRIAVCDKTFEICSRPPYQDEFILISPREEVPKELAGPFDCSRDVRRLPSETKGKDYKVTQASASACGPGGSCCP